MNNKIKLLVVVIILALCFVCCMVIIASYLLFFSPKNVPTNFDECAKMGYPVQESYPARCTYNGKTFTQTIVQTNDYYGSSTYSSCSTSSDCKVGGCNSEICGK